MIKIYHAQGTRSVRPIWLCHELELSIEIERVPFTPEFLSSKEWLIISPGGKLPVLEDGDLRMFESGAMADYILQRYGEGRLQPELGSSDWALHQQWCWFAESTLARPLGINRMLNADKYEEPLASAAREKIESSLSVVEQALENQLFIVGDEFSAADIMLGYSLVLIQRFGILNDRYPLTTAYVSSLLDREALKRTLAI